MAQHQKALLIEEKFANPVLRTVDVPKPGAGQVLVKINSAAVNPMDWKIHKHGFLIDKLPVVLGFDIAGDVVQVGHDSGAFKVGDRVFFQGTRTEETRGFQQYTIAESAFIGKIPHNLTYDDASTLPVAAFTAFVALFQKTPQGLGHPNILLDGPHSPVKESTIVILGGSSQVGQYTLQFAKLAGFSNIITTSSIRHAKHLTSLGATHVLDRTSSGEVISSQVREISGDEGVIKSVIDTISSPETQQMGYDLLSDGGALVMVLPGQEAVKDKVETKKVYTFSAFCTNPDNVELAKMFFGRVPGLFESGLLKTTPVEVLPGGLGGVVDGWKRLEDNQVSGFKLIARPQET